MTEELVSGTAHPDVCHCLSTAFLESPGKAFGLPLPWPLGEEDPVASSFMSGAIVCSGCDMDLSATRVIWRLWRSEMAPEDPTLLWPRAIFCQQVGKCLLLGKLR